MAEGAGFNIAQGLFLQEEASLDDKGRVFLSTRKRDILGSPFCMVMDETGCILALSHDVAQRQYAPIMDGSLMSQGRKYLAAKVFATLNPDIAPDKQGRVVIPQKLRQLAGITKDLLMIGAGDHMQIWDPARHAEYEAEMAAKGGLIDQVRWAMQDMKEFNFPS